MAWFPASEAGTRRLAAERRVLRLLAERCSFQAPRLLAVSDQGFDVRRMVPGRTDPWGLFRRCRMDAGLARRIGRSVGAILAEQHASFGDADVAGWLPGRLSWPQAGDWIRARLPDVVDDAALVQRTSLAIERYEAVAVEPINRVLVHGDVGLHNLALDPDTDAVNGIFDYGGAAWADRHHDFRYLVFDVGRHDMLDAALEVYQPATGVAIDRARLQLYNLACAISYLAFRLGTPAEQKSCGRTLAEDLRWVRGGLEEVGL
jgi:aminoglycoside phosphotransferase (APT) family kinase protein